MKKTVSMLLLFLCALAFPTEAKVPEKNFVEITLTSGEVVTGYIFSGWNRNYLRGKVNYKFSIVPRVDSDRSEQVWYTADDVASVVYTKEDPAYRWESRQVYHKSFSKKKALRRQMVCIEIDDNDAAICWWNQSDGINRYNVMVDVVMYGLLVRDANIVLPIIKGSGKSATVLSGLLEYYMKDSQPEFVEAYLAYIEERENREALLADPSIALKIYREHWKKTTSQ